MGFSAATPRLSDKTRYPLFFRINAPETILNKAVASLLSRFGWKRIAIVKQDEYLFNDVRKTHNTLTCFSHPGEDRTHMNI